MAYGMAGRNKALDWSPQCRSYEISAAELQALPVLAKALLASSQILIRQTAWITPSVTLARNIDMRAPVAR